MRVLLVSQYYEPEVGATQNRMRSFTRALLASGHSVTVVCEQPNHPAGVFPPGWGRRPLVRTRSGLLEVNRLWVAASPRKTTARRLAFYATFAGGALALTAALPRPDVVFATSPPLPGVLAVAAGARARRLPFVVDVRDLWPAAAAALGELSDPRVIALFEAAERRLYRSAAAVTATTQPFCRHIDALAGARVAHHVPNGALDELVALPASDPPEGPLRIGYFGNLGIAQGLDIVLDAARRLAGEGVEFLLVGAGPIEGLLRHRAREAALDAVSFRPPVPPSEVGRLMLSCHALLVPLRDHGLLSDFIPSKLYDGMAVGRPVVVAARGETAGFTEAHGVGWVVAPEDGEALARVALAMRDDRAEAVRRGAAGKRLAVAHSRSAIAAQLCQLLEGIATRRYEPATQ